MKDFSDKSWIKNQVDRPGVGERLEEWADRSTLGKVVVYGGTTVLFFVVAFSILWFGFALAAGLNI